MLRGPQVSKVINQLILGTEWGDLDYLVTGPSVTHDIFSRMMFEIIQKRHHFV